LCFAANPKTIHTRGSSVCTVWNPHSQKNILALEKFKIVVLAGFVEVDSTPKLLHGQSLPMTAVISSIGHHFPLVESIISSHHGMTYFIITSP